MADLLDRLRSSLADRYRIERELGRGGMATVYLAEDLKHRRRVAIKVLSPELGAHLGASRFLREIEIASRLTHPHILPVHDSGDAEGLLYYVMPHVPGESLRDRLSREKQLPLDEALEIAREVGDALDYAHRQGVVHRDIKPENILLEEGHPVVADFGIARAIDAAGGASVTTTGVTLGTPLYMSPEQSSGAKEVDGRSDQYSLGCVLYEMLAGGPPFTGATPQAIQARHMFDPVPPLRTVRPGVPEGVERALARALAKVAADRFPTTSEFAAAIAEPAEAVSRTAGERWRSLAMLLATGVVVGLVAVAAWQKLGPFSHWLGGTTPAHPVKKDWILVADFDGPPDDSGLAVTTRDLLSAALDQSTIVATVPREQIQLALEMAGKPTDSHVDVKLARELAYRRSVRAVLEGKIGRLGQGYSVVLRVMDADTARVILTESAVAKNEDALIPMFGRLAEKLRAGLGEKRGAIATARPLIDVATPSFEAYRLLVQGDRLTGSISPREAIPVLRDALALDPDFAWAWGYLGVNFGNLGQLDSARWAFDEALRRPQRLTTVQRLNIEAVCADDPLGALPIFQRILQYDPGDIAALMNGALPLMYLGRFEEALESTRRAERACPLGVFQGLYENEVFMLSCLGRVDEARKVVRHLEGHPGARWRTYLEIAADDWSRAESLAVSVLADPGLDEDRRTQVLLYLATAQAGRGALRTAAATFERAEEVARGAAEPLQYQDQARRGRLMLAIVSGGAISVPADAWARDSSTATLLTRGLRDATVGDRAGAQRVLNVVRARSRRELARQGATPAVLEARIDALAEQWEDSARLLQPIAAQPLEIGLNESSYPAGMSAVRWFLADAFEKLGHPDSAAVCLERVVSDPAAVYQETYLRGIARPFAHRRLVMLYARMGRIEDANRHWQVFTESVRSPDPELQPLIEEARAALANAHGMMRATGR